MPHFHSPLIPLIVLTVAAGLLFHRLGDLQLQPFDEARRGVSAIEMAYGNAHPLVPTYAGKPDHWGTKPPLLIWAQSMSIRVFGVNPFAVRLPSALASLSLCVLLLWWSRRDWGGYLPGAMGVLYALGSADYLGNHGARSGDFDALLILFLLLQLVSVYRYTLRRKRKYLVIFACSLALAGWTKGVAGCLFLPGLGLWLLLDGDGRSSLLRGWIILAGALGLAAIAVYYPLRETIDPGYLQLVWDNELGGRYGLALEGHRQPWYHYFRSLATDEGTRWLNLFLLPALLSIRLRGRREVGLVLAVAAVYLLVLTVGATKIFWYKNPALPLLGLLIGAGIQRWVAAASGAGCWRWLPRIALILFAGVLGWTIYGSFIQVDQGRAVANFVIQRSPYTTPFEEKAFAPPFILLFKGYQPGGRFLWAGAQVRGESVKAVYSFDGAPIAVGDRVAICTTPDWEFFSKRYTFTKLVDIGHCSLLRVEGYN